MLKRILIVVEPHLKATPAIRMAAALARAGHAEVLFYSGPPRPRPPLADLPDPQTAALWADLDDANEQKQVLVAEALDEMERTGLMSRSVAGAVGDPVRSVVDVALTQRCDLIMVASEGSNAVVRLLTGNIIPGLITASPLPVIVCGPDPSPKDDGAGAAMRRILVILEDSDQAKTALTQALALARGQTAELLLVHVAAAAMVPVVDISSFAAGSSEQWAVENRMQSLHLLASASRVARKAGLTAHRMSLPAGTTPMDLARFAADQACDLIVVAHQGSNALVRLLNGSPIPGLITAATVPVMICRAQEEPPQGRAPRPRRQRHKAAAAAPAGSHAP